MSRPADPPFTPLIRELADRLPRYWNAGGCYARAQAARDLLLEHGYQARISDRLPATAFGYQPRDVWVYADGSYALDRPHGGPGGIRVQQASGHYLCLVTHHGQDWIVDLAAGQFGIEEHPVIRPLPELAPPDQHDTVTP